MGKSNTHGEIDKGCWRPLSFQALQVKSVTPRSPPKLCQIRLRLRCILHSAAAMGPVDHPLPHPPVTRTALSRWLYGPADRDAESSGPPSLLDACSTPRSTVLPLSNPSDAPRPPARRSRSTMSDVVSFFFTLVIHDSHHYIQR